MRDTVFHVAARAVEFFVQRYVPLSPPRAARGPSPPSWFSSSGGRTIPVQVAIDQVHVLEASAVVAHRLQPQAHEPGSDVIGGDVIAQTAG
jgi:hypothetical protein